MADLLRLITIGAGGQITVVRDLETGVYYEKARGSFKATMPAARAVTTSRDRRFAGGRTVAESHDNGQVSWTALVTGASADGALANVENMVSDLRYAGASTRFIEFRADGATYSTLFEIRGPAMVQTDYDWGQFAGARSLTADVQIPVAPLPRGLPMDVLDTFDTDTRSDYSYDAGTSADIAVSGGALTPVVGIALSSERRARHTIRGYTHLDAQATAHAAPGATITSFKVGRLLRASASTYVEVYVDDNGTNSRLRVDVIVAGVRTNRATTNLAARVTSGTELWVRGRIEGNVVYSEYFTSTPTPMGTPTLTGTAYVLTSAEQTSLVAGNAGWSWIPQHASAVIYDLQDEPFTYRNRTLPEEVSLRGTIPGDAPAVTDITITPSGGSAAPIFALLAWTERPGVTNLVWNGDFEDTGTDGWAVALVTGVQAVAGTSITRDTTAARNKYGTANAVIVTPASSGAGANFALYKRFKAGTTYTASLWMSSAAGVTSMVLKLGVNGDVATSTPQALTTTPALVTVAWTPTVDRESPVVSIQTNTATATTFNIDGVTVYEGTTAPTMGRQAEGAGGVPPFGVISAETTDNGDLTGWIVAADAGSRAGYRLYDSSNSGAETYTAGWWIDPNLMVADDFTLGEIDLEVWALMNLHGSNVSPRVIMSARPEAGLSYGAERFTAEWQSTGVLLTKPSTAAEQRRLNRLGTLTLPVDTARPARWKLWMAASTAVGSAGTFGCDYLLVAPSRYRASSPSGKVNDTTYPKFITSTAETQKTILSDLRGIVAKPPFAGTGDRGLGGTPLELPVGNTDLFVKLSSLSPDDPTSDTTTEQLAHSATVHVAVTPRFHAFRSA